MAPTSTYFPDATRPALAPGLRAARVIMLAWAAFGLVWLVVATVTLAPSAQGAGILAGSVAPELAGGVLALRIARLPRWPLLTVTILQIVLAAGDVVAGSVRGVVQVVLPVVVLVLLVRGYRQRRRTGDAGAAALQYAGLIVLAALILGTLVVVGIPQKVETHTRAALCQILDEGHCGGAGKPSAGKRPRARNAGTNGGGDTGGGSSDDHAKCHGFWGCAWHYTGGQVWGFAKGVGKSVWQMGDGLVTSIAHPSQFVKGIGYAATHPVDAAKSIFLGDAEKDWKNGDYGEAIGDVFTNTGSLFIPYADIATGLGDAGKIGKLGELGRLAKVSKAGEAGKLGKLGTLAADADRAAEDASKAAKTGDVAGADKAAGRAEGDAKKIEDQGRKDGCKIAALGGARVPPLIHLGGRAAVPLEDGCTPEEQKKIDAAEKAKKKAKAEAWDAHLKDPPSLRGMDPDDVKKLIPDDWTSAPQKKGEGTKYADPSHPGDQVIIEKGWPAKDGEKPGVHQGPYIKVSYRGQKPERIPLKGNPTL